MSSFEDIALTPQSARVFDMLLDGRSLSDIAVAMKISRACLAKILSRMTQEIIDALPAETSTYHHLLVREFIRAQDEVLRVQVPHHGFQYSEADLKLMPGYAECFGGKAMGARA